MRGPEEVERSAIIALRTLLLLNKQYEHEVTINADQVLEIIDLKETNPASYRAAMTGEPVIRVKGTFEDLRHQGLISGQSEEKQLISASINSHTRTLLQAESPSGLTLERQICEALHRLQESGYCPSGEFTSLARRAGFEP